MKKVYRCLQVFDRDRNGYINASELKTTMSELGLELTDEDAEMMILEADLDYDGKINYQGLYESFVSKDKILICKSISSI